MNFACKNFRIEEVIRCALSLTKAEFRIFHFLMLHSSRKLSTNQIAKELKLDLSTIQRSMKKMADKKIVSRTQINLESGGYNLVYCICNKEEIKNLIKESIKNWSNKFKEEIERW